jgi:TolA-binding protein
MSTELIAVMALLAGIGIGAMSTMLAMSESARRDREHARQLGRLHLATGARLHECQQNLRRREHRCEALVARMAILQRDIEAMREAGTAVAMAAQLDALWQRADWHDSQPAPLDE